MLDIYIRRVYIKSIHVGRSKSNFNICLLCIIFSFTCIYVSMYGCIYICFYVGIFIIYWKLFYMYSLEAIQET